VQKLFTPRNVIPGRPEGPSPEAKHTRISNMFDARRSWVPGSRAVPAPLNDDVWHFFTRSFAGKTERRRNGGNHLRTARNDYATNIRD